MPNRVLFSASTGTMDGRFYDNRLVIKHANRLFIITCPFGGFKDLEIEAPFHVIWGIDEFLVQNYSGVSCFDSQGGLTWQKPLDYLVSFDQETIVIDNVAHAFNWKTGDIGIPIGPSWSLDAPPSWPVSEKYHVAQRLDQVILEWALDECP